MLDLANTSGLFENFEVNGEPFWPRISRLIGGSVALHAVLVAFVILVPPVRNALSIAALFSGAGFVDRPYSKTQIGDDVVELTSEKFHYPEGYFAMDQQPVPTPLPLSPGFAPKAVLRPKAEMPSPTPTPLPSASPAASASPVVSTAPTSKTTPNGSEESAGSGKTEQENAKKAQQELEKTSKETGIELPQEGEINKKPFKDFAIYASELKNQGKLDMEQPFEVVIDTELDQNGKLKNARFTKKAGDVNLVDLGGRLVAAMNESGILFYLKKLNEDNPGTKVVFTIKQNNEQVVATVESEAASVGSARGLANAFTLMLTAGAKTREGKDEEVYLKNTKVSSDGNKILFSLTLPRQTVIDLIKKDLASASASPTSSP
jgi:hypothetical protein